MEHTFTEGVYFLGDPCYALADTVYDDVWGRMYGYGEGKIVTESGSFIVASTEYGDGIYADQDGTEYPVDSGTIALIPWHFCEKLSEESAEKYGRLFTTDESGLFKHSDNTIEVHCADLFICINTD